MESSVKSTDDLIMDSILAYDAGDFETCDECIRDAVEAKVVKRFEDVLSKKYRP